MTAFLLSILAAAAADPVGIPASATEMFAPGNLIAWCMVPFDAKKRGPEERAELLQRLGFKHFAYDWRAEHLPTFDAEIAALRRRGVALDAVWFPADLGADARRVLSVLERSHVRTQLWVTMGDPAPQAKRQEEKVAAAVRILQPIVAEAARIGCKVGLYNHGGWFGEPENQLAIIDRLHAGNVGLVYNLHHGHEHLDRFPQLLAQMKPHLYALNLNGMVRNGEQVGKKILPLAQGDLDESILAMIVASGYRGPIGVIGHTMDDAEERLRDNLEGLAWLTARLQGKDAGPKPTPRTIVKPPTTALDATPGWLADGRPAYRTPPLTVECRATVHSPQTFNILAACDGKDSGSHWELFTGAGDGRLTAYVPGMQPDHVRTKFFLCDGRPHTVTMHYEPSRIRLYCDGRAAADQPVRSIGASTIAGPFGIGRLAEGGLSCDGVVHWVRLSAGVRPLAADPKTAPTADVQTRGLWVFDAVAGGRAEDRSPGKNPAQRTPPPRPAPISATPVYDPARAGRLAAEAKATGDVIRGAHVFADPKFACSSCHKLGGAGGMIGPELTSVAKCLSPEQIAESILWPRRLIKEGYTALAVQTADGAVRQGYKLRETDAELVLRDPPSAAEIRIPKTEIERRREIGTLMPDGLASAMSNDQLRDLVRFLGECKGPAAAGMLQHLHEAASFPYVRDPLSPQEHPAWREFVNRDRVYDFYAKQAEYFRKLPNAPPLLADFPGLDGGKYGHWGNQSEKTWVDGRWNKSDLGALQCGVFRGAGVTVAKAVCVRLGDHGEMAACFNPETLSYEALWRDGFVKFSDVRHGFMEGLRLDGVPLPRPPGGRPTGPFRYHGFYRHGKRVLFAYRIGGVEMLDAPWVENGRFVRNVGPREGHPLEAWTRGGAPQWPQTFAVKGSLGRGSPYAVDTIPLPIDNPWKSLFFFGDHDFLPNGVGMLCTMEGDVWRVDGLTDDLSRVRWKRFAAGLHQALGLLAGNGEVLVLGRDQITRLHDFDGDGEADFYECVSNAYETSTSGHDYVCGLQEDATGNFYSASSKQGVIRIPADGGKVEVLATGFRNPDGLGLAPDGTITVPCSEGDWTPSSMICQVRRGGHFGYGGVPGGKAPDLPLIYLPRGLDNSSGAQTYIASDRWGPTAGKSVHFSYGTGTYFLLLSESVDGQPQGAVVPLQGEFRSGAHRGRFHPKDGQLYVTGMGGWGTYTPDDGCFQRVRFAASAAQLPIESHIRANGVLVKFSEPIAAGVAEQVGSHFAQAWNYRYSSGYGSPEFSPSRRGVVGHDVWRVAGAHLLADGKSLFLELPELQPVNQLHLHLRVDDGPAHDLFLTVHRLGSPFMDFPGYRPIVKTVAPHPILADVAALANVVPNPWRLAIPKARPITVEASKNLTFATRLLTVKVGEPIKLTFYNPDAVPHNWVLARPGMLAKVGDLANRLVADPDAAARQYAPKTEDVLVYTDVVWPGQSFSIQFLAPTVKGRYPYLCSFPGHWMVMNGEMVVE